jgi:hypothetical protein
MIPNKGRYTDCNPINQPPGTWRQGKNFVVNKKKAAFVTEPGTDLTATEFPFDIAKPIGSAVFPDGSYVQFADGINGGIDRIGIVDIYGVYTDLIVDNALGFSSSFPIRSYEVDYNAFGERIVGFTDRYNDFRVLNIDYLPFALNPDKSLTDPSNISDMDGFPKFKLPIFTFAVNQIGGSIFSGAYSACFAYESNDGTRTPNSPPSKMIYITDDTISIGFDKFDGCPPRTRTSKSITFNVTNVDTRYDKIVLIIVRKVGGVTEVVGIKKVDITGTSLNITYVGSETETAISIEQALTPRPLYNRVGCIAQLNSQLYLGDLTAAKNIDYQALANNIIVHYNTKLVSVTNINESHKNVLPGGFAHGGVYALYIAFVLKNGSWSRAFHIPGRPATGNDKSGTTVNLGGTGIPNGTKVYQIEDTTNRPQPFYFTDGDTTHSNSLNGPTNMGFWENQNEKYPAGFPGLAGQNVRHHVFPTIRMCKGIHYSGFPGYGRDQLDVLGIDVMNVQIPADIQEQIEGWGIFYARRDYSNSNTLGTDLYLTAHKTIDNPSAIWSACGNWSQRFIKPGGSDSLDFTPNTSYIRGHNFELQKDMPALGASGLFLDFEIKLRKTNLAADYQVYGKSGGHIAGSGETYGQNAGIVIDYTDTQNCTAAIAASTPLVRSVEEFKYYPSGIMDGQVSTMKNEDIIHMKVFNGGSIFSTLAANEKHFNSKNRADGKYATTANGSYEGEETYLISYKLIKSDLYDEFNNQLLTLTDMLCLSNETFKKKVRGGDTFISQRSFLCVGPTNQGDYALDQGVTVVRGHISEGRYNVGLRHEVIGEITTKYYPKTKANEFWTFPTAPQQFDARMIFPLGANPNGLALSPDYSSTNTYIQLSTYNVNQRLTDSFPFRVIRGGVSSGARSDVNGWKTFLAADYYESNRNRGKITDLFVLDDNLFIHHMYGLFRTLGTEKLSLGSTEVYLGTADIFAQRPKELVTTELGFLGCQNIFAGFTFEGGRFWVDQSRGKVFLLNKNGASEISKDGMSQFFRDNLRISSVGLNEGNPNDPNNPPDPNYPYWDYPIDYTAKDSLGVVTIVEGQGIIAGYDPKFERIILTKKSNVNPFTLSYSVDKEQNYWAFDHDYIPDYLFSTANDLYGYKNNRIHKFNSPTKTARYFEGNPQRSEVEVVFNEENHRNKEFFNVNWISEVFAQSGTLLKDKTLTHIRVRTSYQDSGEVALVPFTTFNARYTTRRFKNTWNFNKMKDNNSDVFKKKSMVDNYCTVTYIFNNEPNLDATQNSLYLYLLNTKALLSEM